MFLSVLLMCSSLHVSSCSVIANTKNLWYTEEECKEQSLFIVAKLLENGIAVLPKCFKIGDSA